MCWSTVVRGWEDENLAQRKVHIHSQLIGVCMWLDIWLHIWWVWFVTESFLGKLEPMEGVSVAAQAIGCQCGEIASSRRAGVSVEN